MGIQALAIAGLGLSGLGAIQQFTAARSSSRFNAAAARQAAETERQRQALKQEQFARDAQRLKARQRVQLAKSGVRLDSGTPLLLAGQLAQELGFKSQLLRAGGDASVQALQRRAALDRLARSNATARFGLGLGRTLLSGATVFNRL